MLKRARGLIDKITAYDYVFRAARHPTAADNRMQARGTITFDGLGATVPAGASYTIAITNPAAGVCVSALGPIRCRQITVRAGGQISACDPAAPPGDSRACN